MPLTSTTILLFADDAAHRNFRAVFHEIVFPRFHARQIAQHVFQILVAAQLDVIRGDDIDHRGRVG